MADGHRNGGFADAASADNRDKAGRSHLRRYSENVLVAPDHADQTARQIGMGKAGGARGHGDRGTGDNRRGVIARPLYRGYEAVTPPSQGCDVSRAVLAVVERLAQAGDMEPQAAFFDGDVGPNFGQ